MDFAIPTSRRGSSNQQYPKIKLYHPYTKLWEGAGMAALYRIISRGHILVVVAWFVITALAIPLALSLDEVTEVESRSFLPEEAESRKALEEFTRIMEEASPGDAGIAIQGAIASSTALIIVEELPSELSVESYEDLRSWYTTFRSEYYSLSWIDLVDRGVQNATNDLKPALLEMVAAYQGGVELWKSYNDVVESLKPLQDSVGSMTLLVREVDLAYSQLVGEWASLVQLSEGMSSAAEPIGYVCLELGPSFSKTYFDIVRIEAILEEYTDAYEEGLDGLDLTVVELLTYLPEAGISSVDRGMVIYVFNNVVAMGGPERFDNTVAADLAYQLIQAQQPDNPEITAAYYAVWKGAVAGLGDFRLPVKADPKAGQLELLDILSEVEDEATLQASLLISDRIISSIGDQTARQAIEAFIEAYLMSGCPSELGLLKVEVLASLLEQGGLPRGVAEALATNVVSGDYEGYKQAAAQAASTLALLEAGDQAEGLDPNTLAKVILELDPDGEGALYNSEDLAREAVVRLISVQLGISEGSSQLLVEGQVGLAALEILRVNTPPEAEPLLGVLFQPEPAKSEEEVLERIKEFLEQQATERVGDPELAGLLAESALVAYKEGDVEAGLEGLVEPILREVVEGVLNEVKGVLVAEDLRGFLILLFNEEDYDEVVRARESVAEGVSEALGDSVEVLLGGDIVVDTELREAITEDLRRSDMASGLLVLAILAAVLGTILGVFMPFVGIGAGLVVAMAAVYLLASNGMIDVTSQARAIMFTTGLGLGIDYSAYVARRFRDNLRGSRGAWEAAGKAAEESVRPVLAGGVAAGTGFLALSLAWDFPFIQSIGYTVPVAIASVVIASLTLTPAILALIGWSGLLWFPSCPYRKYAPGARLFSNIVSALSRISPILLVLVLAAGFSGIYYYAFGFKGEFDLLSNMPEGSEVYEAYLTLTTAYDPSRLFPQYIVTESRETAMVVASELEALECVEAAEPYDRAVLVYVAGNPLSTEAVDCIEEVRNAVKEIDRGGLVGGSAAINLDLKELLYEAFYTRVLPAAVILVFIVMFVFYGSLPAAIAGILSIGFSAGWAISISDVASIALGFSPPWFLPVIVVAALMGVGMDYISFYVNAAREKYLSGERKYYVKAAEAGSGLVIGLALIMASAYGGLMISKVESLKVVGMSLSMGVFLAGLSASLLIIPPAMALLGRRFWWPYLSGVKGGFEKTVRGQES